MSSLKLVKLPPSPKRVYRFAPLTAAQAGWSGVRVRFVEPDPRPRPQSGMRDAAEHATISGVSPSLESLARIVPFGIFGKVQEDPMTEVTTIVMPRRLRDGSVTDEQVNAVFEAFVTGKVPQREAVVVCSGIEKENTARNRARTLAERVKELHGDKDSYRPLAAHAFADPANEGKFIGAVSLKPEPKAKPAAKKPPKLKPVPKPTASA